MLHGAVGLSKLEVANDRHGQVLGLHIVRQPLPTGKLLFLFGLTDNPQNLKSLVFVGLVNLLYAPGVRFAGPSPSGGEHEPNHLGVPPTILVEIVGALFPGLHAEVLDMVANEFALLGLVIAAAAWRVFLGRSAVAR